MKPNNSTSPPFWAITIHDLAPQGYLSFDLKDILLCFGPTIRDYVWAIMELDCTGAEAQSLRPALENPGDAGLIALSTAELLAASQGFRQTIDATLIGAPQRPYSSDELRRISQFEQFPKSQAELVIRAIDSSFFEVITKNHSHVQLIKECFKDVREADASNYFAASGKW